jgi:transcriptional antiterminator RfaH
VSPRHLGCYSIRTAPRWACVYTHPQAEFFADANLRRCGYRTLLPLYALRRRDGRPIRTTSILVPLFSRYLFLMFDHLTESWSPVRATPGVVDLVRAGLEPAYVNTSAVEALEATQALRSTLTPPEDLWRPGDACELSQGPFAGLPAVVTHVSTETANIAVMFLGHLRNLLVPLDCLKARDE